MNVKNPIRWGVLGATSIGKKHSIPAIIGANNATLQALASRSLDKAKEACQYFSIPHAVEGYQNLLDRDDIDAIYIPVVTSQHKEWTLKAIAARKHVLCEKPMVMHSREIDEIEQAARRAGILVAEAYMVAHHPQWHEVRKIISNGDIGDLHYVEASFTYFNTDASNMRNQLTLGGGGLRDIGVYPVVTSFLATQTMPKFVSAKVRRDQNFATDIFASVDLEYDGWSGHFYVGTQMSLRQSMHFHGQKGRITMTAPFNPHEYGDVEVRLWLKNGAMQQVFRFPGVNQFIVQFEAFGHSLLTGEAYPVSLDLSRRVQQVIDACFYSEERDQKVAIDRLV